MQTVSQKTRKQYDINNELAQLAIGFCKCYCVPFCNNVEMINVPAM